MLSRGVTQCFRGRSLKCRGGCRLYRHEVFCGLPQFLEASAGNVSFQASTAFVYVVYNVIHPVIPRYVTPIIGNAKMRYK